jgi:hypothetical protein
MPIYATAGEGRTYSPAPEGVHHAVCCDVIDKGVIESSFVDEKTGLKKHQHKIDIAWQIGELRDDGKRHVVYKRYTLSINEKATLRKDLESWRGRPFTEAELKRFDVESVIGANALVNVQHNQKDGKTYANVVSVMPLIKGMAKMTVLDYERKAAEPHEPPQDGPDNTPDYQPVDDDDIPF